MGLLNLWKKIKKFCGIGHVDEVDMQEDEWNDVLKKKSKDGAVNKFKNFVQNKQLDEKWFPYKCQQLSEELKDCYVLSLEEFKDVVSKALGKKLDNLMKSEDEPLESAYKNWEASFEKCKAQIKDEKSLEIPNGGAVATPLRAATKSYWDTVRYILSKPIMNNSDINRMITKVQKLPGAKTILKEHGYDIKDNNPGSDKKNKKKKK